MAPENLAFQYASHLPSYVSRAVRHGRDRRPRFGLGVRMCTFIKLEQLDEALTGGTDPHQSRELSLRAQQLQNPRKRIRFARAIEKVVDDVGAHQPQILLGVYRRGPVRKNRAQLLALADRLRDGAPVRLRGLARADLLLYRNDSPLYGAESRLQLEREVAAIRSALEPEIVDPPLSPDCSVA